MSGRRIIPIGDTEFLRGRLLDAAGEVLARDGYVAFSADRVAKAAGVPRSMVFRQFRGLEGLVAAFGDTERGLDMSSWPPFRG